MGNRVHTRRAIARQGMPEARAQRLGRLGRALASCNAAVLDITNESELYASACDALVRVGGLVSAWVSQVDHEAGCLRLAESCGRSDAHSGEVERRLEADRHDPAIRAVLEQRLIWEYTPETGATTPFGQTVSSALPLWRGGEIVAVLEVRVRTSDDFDDETRELLTAVAQTIGAGLDNRDREFARRQAEQRLVESENRFQSLLETVPSVAVQGYGMDGTTRYWNRASEHFYGYTSEEAIGRNLLDLIIPPEMHDKVRQGIQHMIDTGEIVPASELPLMRKDGSRITVFSSHASVTGTDGQPELFCIDVDLTEREKIEEALRRSEAEFRTLIESMPQIVWVTRPDGWHTHFNQHWLDYTGLTMEESMGDGWNPPFHPNDRPRAATLWQQVIRTGEPYEIEYRLRRRDGVYRWMLGRALPLRNEAGDIVKWFGTCTDIDDLKRAEQALSLRAHQQVLVARLGGMALSTTDLEYVLSEAATAITEGLGVAYSKVLLLDDDRSLVLRAGSGWCPEWFGRTMNPDSDAHTLDDHVMTCGESVIVDDFREETRFTPSPLLHDHGIVSGIEVPIDGHDRPAGVLGAYAPTTRTFSADDRGFLQSLANTLSAVLDRRHSDDRLAHMAQHDPLTGLPNRTLFMDRLSIALAQAKRSSKSLALLFIDLDRFKSVNDVFGHPLGDQVLCEVATRLTQAVRATDTVSRQGGDEFLVVLPEITDEQEAALVAEKLISAMTSRFVLNGTEIALGGSIGIACFPANGADADALLRNADAAMYAAKQEGRNCYQFYSAEMNARAHERMILESDLRHAIERDEMFVVYQPQIDLATDSIIGLEALLRWHHPTQGLVSPVQFIPIAEDCGLISALGTWVLTSACTQHALWVNQGLIDGTIAVNVSARQFQQPDFVKMVSDVLSRSGLPSDRLELEVTESVFMQGVDVIKRKIDALHGLGVKLTIDDFGIGYSSLSYLQQFPLYRLKIDKSFTAGLPENLESSAISEAIIHLGHGLGLSVLAEGIETKTQEDHIRSLACDAAQGYLYTKPLAVEDCEAFLRQHVE